MSELLSRCASRSPTNARHARCLNVSVTYMGFRAITQAAAGAAYAHFWQRRREKRGWRVALNVGSIDQPGHRFVVAIARGRLGCERRFELLNLRRAQLDRRGGGVLLHVLDALGPGNRDNVRALREQPRQRELRGSARAAWSGRTRPALRHLLEPLHEGEVVREVLPLKARQMPPHIVLGQAVGGRHRAGEKRAAERAERHEPDAELTAQ